MRTETEGKRGKKVATKTSAEVNLCFITDCSYILLNSLMILK